MAYGWWVVADEGEDQMTRLGGGQRRDYEISSLSHFLAGVSPSLYLVFDWFENKFTDLKTDKLFQMLLCMASREV